MRDADGQRWTESAMVEALEWPDLRVATELATMLAAARWGSAWYPPPEMAGRPPTPLEPPRTTLSAAKLRFDAAQFAHLRERDVLDAGFDAIIADYGRLSGRLDRCGAEARLALEGDDRGRIGHVYNRIVHVAQAARVPQ